MKGSKAQGYLFTFWITFSVISIIWMSYALFAYTQYFIRRPAFNFLLILGWTSLIVALISIRHIFSDVKSKITDKKENEKTVQDVYRYQQLLDPPDTNMYN